MSGENGWGWGMTPVGVPVPLPSVMVQREEERWRHFDNSINAVSFGFVATAILISMFLVMAIFERFLRPRSTDGSTGGQRNNAAAAAAAADLLESGMAVPAPAKFAVQSPNMSIYAKGVSVLMPGEEIPTFIGHPAPVPPPPPIPWHAPVLVHLGGSQGLIVSPATTHSTFRSASASTTP